MGRTNILQHRISKNSISLYYSIFVFVFLYYTLTFYVPILAVHQLGLDLAVVKLTLMDASIFGFVAFIATYLLVQWISQHNILAFGIVSLVVRGSSFHLQTFSTSLLIGIKTYRYMPLTFYSSRWLFLQETFH